MWLIVPLKADFKLRLGDSKRGSCPKKELRWNLKVPYNSKMLLLCDLTSPGKSKAINYSVGGTDPNKTRTPQSPFLQPPEFPPRILGNPTT